MSSEIDNPTHGHQPSVAWVVVSRVGFYALLLMLCVICWPMVELLNMFSADTRSRPLVLSGIKMLGFIGLLAVAALGTLVSFAPIRFHVFEKAAFALLAIVMGTCFAFGWIGRVFLVPIEVP